MKPINTYLFCLLVIMISSCVKKTETVTQETDAKELAEDRNDEKFENTSLKDDSEFALKAAEGGLMEVKLGELAQTQASSPEVKKFAQQMITDHSKANTELQQLAREKNISIPTSLGEDKQKKYDDFASKKGEEFDRAYSDFMVKDHKEDVDLFQKEADNGGDPELKAWAAKTVPVLKHHLQMAEDAEKAVKANKRNQ